MNNEQKYKEAIENVIEELMMLGQNHPASVPVGKAIHKLKEVIKPPFEPVEGVVYAFWDDHMARTLSYGKFNKMVGEHYQDWERYLWDSCRPLTAEERGEK